jgi:hypothetical protein
MSRGLKERKRAALARVARHFGATPGDGRRAAHLTVRGKRIAVEVAVLERRIARVSNAVPPRLRFDRVVYRVFRNLGAALSSSIPSDRTAMVTITAPIRVPAKTVAVLTERTRMLLGRRSSRPQLADTVHGNQIRIRIMPGGQGTPRLFGFVHNRGSDPTSLFTLSQSLLECVPPPRGAGLHSTESVTEHWLVIVSKDPAAWTGTYRHLCSELFAGRSFKRILLVDGDGGVSEVLTDS